MVHANIRINKTYKGGRGLIVWGERKERCGSATEFWSKSKGCESRGRARSTPTKGNVDVDG